MGSWALSPYEQQEYFFTNAGNSSAANSKSAWTQGIAATSFAYQHVEVFLGEGSSGSECYLVDIGIGAGGSEVVVVPNMLFDVYRGPGGIKNFKVDIPLYIPAGARIAVRSQTTANASTRASYLGICGHSAGWNGGAAFGDVTCYGANTGTTNGVYVDPGATAWTWGAWTEIVAATTYDHQWLQPMLGSNKQNDGTDLGGEYAYEVGLGGAGSEITIAAGRERTSYGDGAAGAGLPLRQQIPAGSRLSMRTLAGNTGAWRNHTAVILAG